MDQQSPCDWEALKPDILQLYLVENKSLVEVVAAIKTTHKLRVTYDLPRALPHSPVLHAMECEGSS